MSYKSTYSRGNWLTICDACGRKYPASSLQQRWDGLMVCSGDWEPRQPQDFVRGVADIQAPKWTRPEQQDSFIPFNLTSFFSVTSNNSSSLGIRVIEYSDSKQELNAQPVNSTTVG